LANTHRRPLAGPGLRRGALSGDTMAVPVGEALLDEIMMRGGGVAASRVTNDSGPSAMCPAAEWCREGNPARPSLLRAREIDMEIYVSPLEASADWGQDFGTRLQAERREMQAWLHSHPAAKSERRALQALVVAARRSSSGRVTCRCQYCGWVGYPGTDYCPKCGKRVRGERQDD